MYTYFYVTFLHFSIYLCIYVHIFLCTHISMLVCYHLYMHIKPYLPSMTHAGGYNGPYERQKSLQSNMNRQQVNDKTSEQSTSTR